MIFYRTAILFFALHSLLLAGDDFQNKILNSKNSVFPSLVHIQPVKEIFSSGKRVKIKVTGSGVIFSSQGHVLTNNHVAEKAEFVVCTLFNQEEITAEVVGLDPLTDLAVLKLNLDELRDNTIHAARFGDSDSLEVGQFVMALGSPLGLSRSVSLGVISSLDRYFEDIGDMVSPFNLWIQTDAAINPGNSGGPLVDLNGNVIGINARGITFGENLGFAIPINTAKLVIDRILKEGEVARSTIGVEFQNIKEYREYLEQPQLEGVLIANVDKHSPAENAGLRPGDLVLSIEDKPVSAIYLEELPKIRKFIAEIPVGTAINIGYQRNGIPRSARLTTNARGKFEGTEFECEEWGLAVKEITPRNARNLKLKDEKGVLVSGVRRGSPADEADVFRGYVITKVDDRAVENLQQFETLYTEIKQLPAKGRMLELVFSNTTRFALLKENF